MKIKRTAVLAALFSLLSIQVDAQLKTWFTLETGPQWSMIKVADPGGYFQGANVKSFMSGITVGQEILPKLTVVTGVLYMPQNDGINMIDERPHQSSWHASNSILIPVRAEYIIQPTEYPVCFTPRIGYIYNLDSQPDELYSASSILSAPDGTALSYDIQQVNDQPSIHLLEIGMGVNLRFSNSWQASLNLSHMTALFDSPSTRFNLDYSDSNGNTTSTAYTSKGNALYTTLALNIPVSNIWQNKDYRVRARIENSVYKGKAVSKRGQVYLGGEVGSLWRKFNSTNPAVGARPLEDRGVFRYANLHTGIYAGYMLTDELGIDIGANYQRSTTFYAVMYDHEVDFVTRMPAPFYLEIPLRFRYFYNVYKEKIHVVIYGGASLLAHFSTGVYNQGSAGFTYNSPTASAPVSATTSYAASGVKRFAPVLRLGTGIEYALPIEFPLIATLYLNYMQGYRDVGQIEVSNTIPETPPLSTITYNGTGWSVDLGVKIPFYLGDRGKCGKLPEKEKK
ncbi:MAG: hypothetical protein K8R52_01700 [Bacteroidales bacterium]|nr:hypothetical protein [Bacteroidales bacterium]